MTDLSNPTAPTPTCRHCDVPIIWFESIAQWWHIAGPIHYRGCRDKAGKLTGRGHAEPEEKA